MKHPTPQCASCPAWNGKRCLSRAFWDKEPEIENKVCKTTKEGK